MYMQSTEYVEKVAIKKREDPLYSLIYNKN
jgi:hypothetical protein